MNEFESFAENDNPGPSVYHAETNGSTVPSGSGLTLKLPSLKALKASKSLNKAKPKGAAAVREDVKVEKVPRPVKLKPLKEVLTKLIAQIKKKDDYAFFLDPVPADQIPGYTDVIKRPMDFGTISTKVSRGKYRSLEEFTSDFRLVTSNAKTFNPLGTIYHTEADRIETWGLDHIAKSASTVIEYETDWNIDVEQEDDATTLNIDENDAETLATAHTPMDLEGSPAPSVQQQQQANKRGRGKKIPTISESIDAEGRLPGSKDGLAAFPPGSDWSELMLALKLRGKRYRTKKERLKMEKGGPPYTAEGSLDYLEVEDPFSILSVFAPEPLTRPILWPLHQKPDSPVPTFYHPVNIAADRPLPIISRPPPSPTQPPAPTPASTVPATRKRRHWTITRAPPSRARIKEKDKEQEREKEDEEYQLREALPADFGSFAGLTEEMSMNAGMITSEDDIFAAIRQSVEECDVRREPSPLSPPEATGEDKVHLNAEHWQDENAHDGPAYIRDLVFGGADGLAYVRSLAEFVRPPSLEESSPPLSPVDYVQLPLGMPLARYVEETIVNPTTHGRHAVLRAIAARLALPDPHSIPDPSFALSPELEQALARSLEGPSAGALAQPLALDEQLDLASLIYAPEELFIAEDEWAGAAHKRRKTEEALKDGHNAMEYLALAIQSHREAEAQVTSKAEGAAGASAAEDSQDVLEAALEYSAETIEQLLKNSATGAAGGRPNDEVTPVNTQALKQQEEEEEEGADAMDVDGEMKPQVSVQAEQGSQAANGTMTISSTHAEDVLVRKLRLNLLALAKRAPLDKIARLPADKIPVSIRHCVPTL